MLEIRSKTINNEVLLFCFVVVVVVVLFCFVYIL